MTLVRSANRWMLGLAMMSVSVGAGACASSGGGGGGGGSSDVISETQLAEMSGSNAFEAIQRYRPRWLRPARNQNSFGGRATAADRVGGADQDVLPGQEIYPRVYMDGSFFGDINGLTQIPVDALESVEFIDSRDATTLYGTGNMAGVIELHTKGISR